MKNRQAIFFLMRFSLAIFVAIGIMLTVGYIAYRSLNKLVATISQEGKPNIALNLLKDIQYDLTDAELNARSYATSGDTGSVQWFYTNIDDSKKKLEQLKKLSFTDHLQENHINEITALIDRKKEVMQELITVKEDSTTAITQLEHFKTKIATFKDTSTTEKKVAEEKTGKRNFIQKIFGKKEKEESTLEEPGTKIANNYIIANLSRQLDELTIQQREAILKKQLQEQHIIEQDRLISYNIRQLIDKISKYEYRKSLVVAKHSKESAAGTTLMIFILSILTILVLLVSGIIVFKYIRTNQRFRKILSESKNRAEHLAKQRLEYLSNMSHEIRTPLNAIVGFSEQLGKKNLNPDQEQSVRIIRESSEHLSQLISDVLDHAKMENGKFTLEKIPFRPMEIFQQAFDFFRTEAQKKGLQLSLFYINNIPEYIVGDPMRLKQVLLNLLSNSLKFTAKGFIKMDVQSVRKSNETIVLKIKIVDSGIGIAPEKQKHVFDEYTQAAAHITRKYGGTGLGLSIAKKLIEIQGGTINLESELNTGTSFELTIPFALNYEPLMVKNKSVFFKNLPAVQKLKILAADDENYNRLLLEHIFDKWNIKLDYAIDGLEVLEKVEDEDYDLILMDVKMPYLDGMEATKKIRNEFGASKRNIPIIAITAGTLSIDRKKCLDVGMNNFITKPFKESELVRIIAETLKLETMEVNMDKNLVPGHEEELNLHELENIIGNDEVLMKKMITTFIESSEKTITEIEEAFRHEDYRELTLLAHRLAAPARHMSFNHIADKLKNIENFETEKINKSGLHKLITEVKINVAAVNEKLKHRLNLTT
jgi:signal transduction histidine kinase/CheY-like chemotaxis protein/CHASE3 domain sensor protein/HPt (histidine-containing phosphotransfer) domain-containing protein